MGQALGELGQTQAALVLCGRLVYSGDGTHALGLGLIKKVLLNLGMFLSIPQLALFDPR